MWFIFFFFKQKTAYEMRISDWSSDVCSSDLWFAAAHGIDGVVLAGSHRGIGVGVLRRCADKPEQAQCQQGDYRGRAHGSSPQTFSMRQAHFLKDRKSVV